MSMFFRGGLYLVKKNPKSTETPWLGVDIKGEEMFGSLLDFLGMGQGIGAYPKGFNSTSDAFAHIKKKYPEDIGVMQVYHATENAEGIKLTHVPWPS